MKQIKKIVLRDATKLTNSEMKKIRGGYEPERSAVCTVQCPAEFGGSSVELDCSNLGYCDIRSGVDHNGIPFYGAGCYYQNGYPLQEKPERPCERIELLK